jgi:hypothetical protein
MRILVLAAALIFTAATVQAETFPVVTDTSVVKECGDCHMVFPPQTLPQATWTTIIGDLSNHFGEDASLDAATTASILNFHVNNASDVSQVRAATKWRMNTQPTRIITASRFIAKHRGCEAAFAHESVKSPANCIACHADMQKTGSTKENISFLPRDVRETCGED